MKKALLLGLGFVLVGLWGCGEPTMTLATTTSTYDSGLLEVILPPFERANGVKVKVIALGTGQAIALGERGDADVLLVHAPTREEDFVAQGFGVHRSEIMYNDFVIIGPEDDPANIRGLKSAVEAFSGIASSGSPFVSRGDESGTHAKEKTIWEAASIQPDPEERWYVSAGQGMGGTLTMAEEKRAYTLTDRGTFLARKGGLSLVILAQGDELLFNPYHVMAVNPARFPHAKYDLALKFIDYLTALETQEVIAGYGKEEFGEQLFFPSSERWRAQR